MKILLVEFPDITHHTDPVEYTKQDFEDMLISLGSYVSPDTYTPDGDAVYGSMHDYFNKMSSGNVTITGYVVNNIGPGEVPEWVTLMNTKAYYYTKTGCIFADDAVSVASAQGLDVSTPDNFTTVAIIYAGNVHTFRPDGVHSALNPQICGRKYIMSELQGRPYNQENSGDKFSRIGMHAHEFAHRLGIGHASGSRASLMEAGYRNGPGSRSAAPAPINPAQRIKKGWLSPINITGQQQFDAQYSLINPQVFRINSNYNNDYFLIENRRFDQNMTIGSTVVPDYNNSAFFPPSWPHGSITQGIFVWRIIGGNPTDYSNNGLVYASGIYGATCPEETPSETDDGVPFPGNCNVAVLSPWSDPRNPYTTEEGHYTIYVPNTLNSTNVGMEILSENESQGYFTIMLYQTNPEDAKPSKPKNLTATFSGNDHPYLTWDPNTEPDFLHYEIWKKSDGSWSLLATTTDNFYEDITETRYTGGRNKTYVYYKIRTVDTSGKKSNYSNTVSKVVKEIIRIQKSLVDKDKIPSIYALEQNHPNPFNATSTIRYDLPEASFVNLRIYDINGREVRTLVNGIEQGGTRKIIWDGTDESGTPVSSGIYLYRMSARSIDGGESFSEVRKIVFLQ